MKQRNAYGLLSSQGESNEDLSDSSTGGVLPMIRNDKKSRNQPMGDYQDMSMIVNGSGSLISY
jgi:hypothetical protein